MSETLKHSQLQALLQHPSLWRGRGAATVAGIPTGFSALDAALPGGGWPRCGVVEILTAGSGFGELTLWAPLVAQFTRAETARWCTFVAPPFEPFAPAWSARGARLDRLLVVRAPQPLWALEQCLLSGACAIGFAWPQQASMTELRRLALAAERGASMGVLIRPLRAAAEHSVAVLRIALTRSATHLRLQLLKGRGLAPRIIELLLP
ncbi:MAG: translesion DNA synthesis-associated protein ImuA [Steroidobacteraceae bacterium]